MLVVVGGATTNSKGSRQLLILREAESVNRALPPALMKVGVGFGLGWGGASRQGLRRALRAYPGATATRLVYADNRNLIES
jgi:hypothetical protein